MITVRAAGKTLCSLLVFGFYFSGVSSAVAASLNISQKPLMLSESVSPNMLLTLDDSGSMTWAFAPDNQNGIGATRRAKSNAFNPMYYDPNAVYTAPKIVNSGGTEQQLSTLATSALHNGYDSARGTVNLTNDYKVHWTYDPNLDAPTAYGYSNTTPRLAENPYDDFTGTVTRNNNGTSTTTTPGGIVFSITRTGSNSCTATASYPGIFSNLTVSCSRPSSNTYTATLYRSGVPAYYYVYDATKKSNCSTTDEDCYTLRFVTSAEQQNFANWYSFYRNRTLATISAAALAFYNLSPEVRLSWQALNSCTTFSSTNPNSNCRRNELQPYTIAHKAQLYSWLQNLPASGGTPLPNALIRAGDFLSTARPWQKNPGGSGNTVANTYACRPSFHIMMTDGIWGPAVSGATRHDNSTFTVNGNSYSGQRPFQDSQPNTLADWAMHYWATDQRPTLANGLKPYLPYKSGNASNDFWDPRNDPATWQHMTNFVMGLGLSQSLSNPTIPWAGSTHEGAGYQALLNGTPWPPAAAGSGNNVYDLWHTALNSRGEFFSVDSPEAMVSAFKEIINRISDRTTTAARPAVSASFITDSINKLQSRVFSTQFSSEDWSGELSKITVTKTGQTIPAGSWNTRTANAGIDPSARKVVIKNAGNPTTGLQDFAWANLTAAQKSFLNTNPEGAGVSSDSRGVDRLNFIRGDRSNEGTTSPQFRERSTVFGDIINSSPALVGPPAYLPNQADMIEKIDRGVGYRTYASFIEEILSTNKRKEMIYVGGNDGMLHGIEAETGKEVFAYIPNAVFPNLNKLSGQNYVGGEHRYFVDGSPIVRDVYFDNTLGWRTVLIGTLRAGGKALFALDVTDPENIKLLWEFDSSTDVDLGNTFAQPEIVRLHTGQWAVLQGNGYNSTNDKAALLVIDIKTGALLKKIVVPDVVENSITLPNGLSSVRAADNNSDGLADYAYAGDLQGNIWRFDLVPSTTAAEDPASDPFDRSQAVLSPSNFNASQFTLSYGSEPLFVARDSLGQRQPITIQPSLVRHPTNRGYLVLVGTGKYFEDGDANVDTSRAMTLYGIWDRKTRRQSTNAGTLAKRIRANLHKQEITEQIDDEGFGDAGQEVINDIRLVSDTDVKWFRDLAGGEVFDPVDDKFVEKWGWRLDLAVENSGGQTLAGEMIVNDMAARGTTLLLSSLTPNSDPCESGATTWFYGVDAHTGGRTKSNVLDLNNDRKFDGKDQYQNKVVTGRKFNAPGGFTLSPGGVFGEGGQPPMTLPPIIGVPRQSWHIIPEDFQ